MNTCLKIVPAGEGVDQILLGGLARSLGEILPVECEVEPQPLDIGSALDPDRRQHRADQILRLLSEGVEGARCRRLGVTAHDLFLPVLTHVFGAGQLTGPSAVVSIYRLREEVYGLPHSQQLLEERLLKEALHEVGHTAGLRHCSVWQCVMSSSSSVELVDLKAARFCPHCEGAVQRILHGGNAATRTPIGREVS